MMNLTQSLRQAVQKDPDGNATLFLGRRRTWTQVSDRVSRLATAFTANGLKRGDRVAVLALNSDRYFETYFAVWWAGGVIVPLNTRWNIMENLYALKDSEPTLFLVDGHFDEQITTILSETTSIKNTIYMGEGMSRDIALNYEALIAASKPAQDALCDGDDLAGIFYTGGTTGKPKGVMLTHKSIFVSSIGGIAGGVTRLDNHVFLHHAPMFHLADAASITMITMLQGTHAVIEQFDPRQSLEAIEKFKVTHTIFVPSMLSMFLQHPDFEKHDLTSLKRIGYGASPMPVALLRESLRRFPNIEFIQGYGQTELSPIASFLLAEEHVLEGPGARLLHSAGRALPHCEIKVVDSELHRVPKGVVGQICVRGANTMLGYWKLPELTANTIVDGWVLTGDAGYLDSDGYLFLVDRVKDMIVSGGENVYSVEVENIIMEYPGVAQCAVIGVPDDKWVEAVHAIIVTKPGVELSRKEIIAHCHTYIAGYKCPRSIDFCTDPLPLSGAGKVLKRELRRKYWADKNNVGSNPLKQ